MIDTSKVGPYQFVTEGMALVTMDGQDNRKHQRRASFYRAARRNAVKTARGVWRSSAEIKHRPAEPRGSSAAVTFDGVRHSDIRRPRRTYKPNGAREVARRKARMAA